MTTQYFVRLDCVHHPGFVPVVSSLPSVSHDIPLCPLHNPCSISLLVPSNLQALATVLAWFDQLSQVFNSQEDWDKCRIALAEGFTNAVKHAHGHLPPETPIELEVFCGEASVEMQIWDQGSVFDLDCYLAGLPPKSSQDAESGRGLRLIREIADHVSYRRTEDGRNCLRIAKQLSTAYHSPSLMVSPPS
ncbi:MAG: ATP-binding protein [Synechococcales cyanobacterium CRU_2_2]|nr:ATP-binding protein [Synechococcales cyanobacterium CRU_2_2]